MSQNFMKEVKQMKQTMKRVKNVLSVVAILMVASRACGASSAEATKSVRLVLPAQAGPVVENTSKVFTRQVQQRCEAKVVTGGAAPLTVELAVEKGIGAEGYRIEDRQAGGVRIAGNDERGLVAGVGKFLRTSRYDKGGFTPGTWRGTSVPQKPVRGIYFAVYVAVASLSLPGAAILTLAGGGVFGLGWGLLLVSFASTLGATVSFLAARFVLRDAVQARFGERLAGINQGVARDGALYLFSLRLRQRNF